METLILTLMMDFQTVFIGYTTNQNQTNGEALLLGLGALADALTTWKPIMTLMPKRFLLWGILALEKLLYGQVLKTNVLLSLYQIIQAAVELHLAGENLEKP